MKDVLFVVLDAFAEWEAAPLAAAINQAEGYHVKTVSVTKAPLKSIGGFTILPDLSAAECLDKDYCALILIGGKNWRTGAANLIAPLVYDAVNKNAVIAGICDASVYLGSLGLLNTIEHTSNTLEDMQGYLGQKYSGTKHYKERQAVRDGKIITANGTAGLEFAREVLLALGFMAPQEVEQWYRFYKLGYYT